MHRRTLHPQVVWVQRRCYGHAKPTLRRSGRILLAVATFSGGSRMPVWSERRQFPVDDGSAAVVHHWMLPRPRRYLDNRECRRRAQGVSPGHRTDSGSGPKHNLGRPREQRERNCAAMSSSPASVSAAAISVPLLLFSGSSKVVFRPTATISAVPREHSLSAAPTLSIVEVSSGAR